jgi:hypothetical protein
MISRSVTRWSWRLLRRFGVVVDDVAVIVAAGSNVDPADDVVAGLRRFVRCLERGLYLERPEGEQ